LRANTTFDGCPRRLKAIRNKLGHSGLDAYLATDVKNVYYLTGFLDISTASLNMIIPLEGTPTLLVMPLSLEAATTQARGCQVKTLAPGDLMIGRILEELKSAGLRRIGFDNLQLQTYLAMTKESSDVELVNETSMVAEERRIKDSEEISFIRRASEITDAGMEAALGAIRSGAKEYEVAGEAEYAMRMRGSMGAAFDTLVASGPRSAYPHGLSTDREICDGDLVTVDLGATWKGYCSDLTRTVVVGKGEEKAFRMLRRVKEVHDRVLGEIRHGVDAARVDEVARTLLGPGLAEYFVHGLGHGVGLDIHEAPTMSRTSKDVLEAGNVVTDEPGVYLGGFGGVRTEDTVLVTEKGCEKLTSARYE
jgi:Xaa-Pro aminopeptidase